MALLVLAGTAACNGDSGGDSDGRGDLRRMQSALIAFQSCGELENYIDATLVAEIDEAIELYQECQASGDGCYWYAYDMAIGAPTARGGGWAVDDSMGGPGGGMFPDAPSAGGDGASGGEGSGGDQSGGNGSTGGEEPRSDTNVQEEGVDEADIVKQDGEFLYILNGNRLRIVRSSPVDAMEVVGSAELSGSPLEMFLAGDRLAVFASEYRYNYGDDYYPGGGAGLPKPDDGARPEPAMPAASGGSDGDDAGKADSPSEGPVAAALAGLQGEILVITVFDVSDRANPSVVRQSYLEGGYVSSRMVGTKAHIVVRSAVSVPSFDWYQYVTDDGSGNGASDGGSSGGGGGWTTDGGSVPPVAVDGGPAPSEADAGSATEPIPAADAGAYEERREALTVIDYERLRADFLALLADTELDEMMPQRVDVVNGQPLTGSLVPCESFYHPSVTMGLNVLAVVTIDLGEDSDALAATGILGSSDTVYASGSTLYVATYVYDYWRWMRAALNSPNDTTERTAIHAFDISGTPSYLGSGFVEGQILNQFGMSEWQDHLRVATTVRNWQRFEPMPVSSTDAVVPSEPQDATDNLVTVLALQGDELVRTGLLRDLGKPNESIFAARFFGPLGYVVTFEQRDPLYVIDVSDPTAPTKRGELDVPGFSSYIHPLGDSHLLTIGRGSTDPVGNPEGTDGLKLSVFDVSNPDAPAEVESEVFPAYSEAEYQHKAFTFYEHLDLLAIPIGSYWWSGNGEAPLNGLAIFHVDPAEGIELVGSISHDDLVPTPDSGEYRCGYYMPQVRRGLFVGERVYSVSDVGVKANEAVAGLAPLNAVAFPDDGGWYSGVYGGAWGDCYYGGGWDDGGWDREEVPPDGGGEDGETPREP
jgi:uncharacterized secreted protein with C-terminal beta-propeller domain